MFLARLGERWGTGWLPGPIVLFTLLQLPSIIFSPGSSQGLIDRYFIFLMPGALYLAVPRRIPAPAAVVATVCALAVFGGISLCLMHDWLAWNSARWALGRQAIAGAYTGGAKINPIDIEGGFEWDGWFMPITPAHPDRRQPVRLTLPFSMMFFPHVMGKYALAFTRPDNSGVLAREPYSQWLMPGRHEFLFLEFEGEEKQEGQ
jgi:hypothetical protein